MYGSAGCSANACPAECHVKAVLWAFLVIFSYHALAGVRHLIMDIGIGEDFKGGALSARILFVAFAMTAVAWGIVLW